MSPTSSFETILLLLMLTFPPIDFKIFISKLLEGFKPTFLIINLPLLDINPATIKNDAEEKSPTTS